jgi:hypothetical protein
MVYIRDRQIDVCVLVHIFLFCPTLCVPVTCRAWCINTCCESSLFQTLLYANRMIIGFNLCLFTEMQPVTLQRHIHVLFFNAVMRSISIQSYTALVSTE